MIVKHPTKEKFQVPVEKQVTAYALARQALDEKKLLEAKIKKLCTTTGMAYDAARRSVLLEEELENSAPTDS